MLKFLRKIYGEDTFIIAVAKKGKELNRYYSAKLLKDDVLLSSVRGHENLMLSDILEEKYSCISHGSSTKRPPAIDFDAENWHNAAEACMWFALYIKEILDENAKFLAVHTQGRGVHLYIFSELFEEVRGNYMLWQDFAEAVYKNFFFSFYFKDFRSKVKKMKPFIKNDTFMFTEGRTRIERVKSLVKDCLDKTSFTTYNKLFRLPFTRRDGKIVHTIDIIL